jgi:hypothetical protein
MIFSEVIIAFVELFKMLVCVQVFNLICEKFQILSSKIHDKIINHIVAVIFLFIVRILLAHQIIGLQSSRSLWMYTLIINKCKKSMFKKLEDFFLI